MTKSNKPRFPKLGPEATYTNSIVAHLRANGSSQLPGQIGSACKRPAGVKEKLKKFIEKYPAVFDLQVVRVRYKTGRSGNDWRVSLK